jgi:hypothetical protein
MKDISKIDFYDDLDKFLKPYDFSTSHTDKFIEIKNNKTGLSCITNFDEREYKDEMAPLKKADDCIVYGDNFINFLLHDKDNTLKNNCEIEIDGGIKGKIIKRYDYLGILTTNLDKVININSFDYANSVAFADIIRPETVICELTNIDIKGIFKDKEELSKLIYSVLSYLSFHFNITLEYPKDSFIYNSLKAKEYDKLNLMKISNLDCMHFFISAERMTYPHFKYVEYYHIVEYYFLSRSIDYIKKMIKNIITVEMYQNKKPEDSDYYDIFDNISHYANRDQNRELIQITSIFTEDMGYAFLHDVLNKLDIKLNFLETPLFNDPKTKVNLSKTIYADKKNKLLFSSPEEGIAFCSELASRVYSIRNYCVHTKKSEKHAILTPTSANFAYLEKDIILLRSISFAFMTQR